VTHPRVCWIPMSVILIVASSLVGLVVRPTSAPLTGVAVHHRRGGISVASASFTRATDVLSLGDQVPAKDVINVLGRWTSWTEWDGIGELVAIDKLFDENGREKVKQPAQQSSGLLTAKKGNGDWVKKTPQRRGWCLRNGLVQRYWFSENVKLLPFKCEALAASVGSSCQEMNAMPISEMAIDVCFDALSRSQSGIIQRELCEERRSSYASAEDGGFDAAAFQSDLNSGKLTVVRSFMIFPGSIILVQAGLFYKLDGWHQWIDYYNHMLDVLGPAYFGMDR